MLLDIYRIEDKYKTLIFCDVDENGNFIQVETGKNIIPGKEYQHFFYRDRYVADTITNYKVINGELTVIDLTLEDEAKVRYFGI